MGLVGWITLGSQGTTYVVVLGLGGCLVIVGRLDYLVALSYSLTKGLFFV